MKSLRYLGRTGATLLAVTLGLAFGARTTKDALVRADGNSGSEVAIDETNFPDASFRNFVKTKFDVDPSDGKLSESEIKAAKTVNCRSANIKDLTGIEYFTALEYLNCSDNELETLNLSRNPKLVYLYCYENQLTGIRLNENVNLKQVFCSDNRLTSLDLKGSTNLVELDCKNNALTALNVSKCTNLQELNLAGNEVTALNVSSNTKLTFLSLADNLVSTLNVSNNQALTELNCSYNRLTSLNIKNHTELRKLYCQLNSLKSLDLSGCTKLTAVNCSSNYLTSQPSVPSGCSLTYSPQSAIYSGYVHINKTNFPDKNFRAFVAEKYDVNPSDEYLSPTEISNAKTMICKELEIKSLEGISFFTALTKLDCSHNLLTELDLSKNTNLEYLDIYSNHFEKIDFGYLTKLKTLMFYGNKELAELHLDKNVNLEKLSIGYHPLIDQVDLSKNTNLVDIFICDLNLTGLDLGNCKKLEHINCCRCGLSELSLENKTKLIELCCSGNYFSSLDLKNCPALLCLDCRSNQLTSLVLTKNTELAELDCSSNQLTDLDISPCPKLTYVNCKYNYLEEKPAVPDGCTLLYDDQYERAIAIDETNFPDAAFRQYVSQNCDKSPKDGVLSLDERKAVKSLYMDLLNIESLEGIKYFPELELLNCSDNRITSLNLSYNKKLETLLCEGNRISDLYIRGNLRLKLLYCYSNKLTSLDVSRNTLLRTLNCSENKIEELSVNDNLQLETLNCRKNSLTVLDVRNNTALKELDCGENAITELDVSKNSGLTWLQCDSTDIGDLNVTSNPELKRLYCSKTAITELDLSKNTNLEKLEMRSLKIQSIDVSKNVNLIELDLAWCHDLANLNVSNNTNLGILYCWGCNLSELDLSKTTNLRELDCANNRLTGLDLSSCTMIKNVECEKNYIPVEPQVPANCQLKYLPQKKGPKVEELNVTSATNSSLTLSWTKPAPQDGYEVEAYVITRSTSENGEYQVIANLSDTQYTDTGLKPNTKYYYQVSAYIVVKNYLATGDYASTYAVTLKNTPTPTKKPATPTPTKKATPTPTKKATPVPTKKVTPTPSTKPGTPTPTKAPTGTPTKKPTKAPTLSPTKVPTKTPTGEPTKIPTLSPTNAPTKAPTKAPTLSPTKAPTGTPTKAPTGTPGQPTVTPKPGEPTPTTVPGQPTPTGVPGPGDPTPTGAPDQPTPTPVPADPTFEDFVERLYVVALGRHSEKEGKDFWVEKVVNGEYNGADCARFFLLEAPEFMNRGLSDEEFVETLYKTFFDRASDAAGKAGWVDAIKTGKMTRAIVVENFIESTEWCNVCATYGVRSGAKWHKAEFASKNAINFATRLYTCCLGRDPEEKGLEYWSLALTNLEQTGCSAAREFFTSAEFIGLKTSDEEYLKRLYTTFMDREPEASEVAYWAGEIAGGRQTRDSVLAFFGQSEEFTAICKRYGIERGTI